MKSEPVSIGYGKTTQAFQVTLKKDDGWNLDSGWFDVTIVPAKGVTVSKYLRLALLIMVGVSCILLFACECEP